jgi:hypothetical protein
VTVLIASNNFRFAASRGPPGGSGSILAFRNNQLTS